VVSACIILQGGGGRRRRSDKSRPHKKRATSGLLWEARSYPAGSKPKRFLNCRPSKLAQTVGMRTALQSFRLQYAAHPVLVEPSKDTKNRPGGQWSRAPPTDKSVDHGIFWSCAARTVRLTSSKFRLRPVFHLRSPRVLSARSFPDPARNRCGPVVRRNCDRLSHRTLCNLKNWDTSESVTSPPLPSPKFPRMSLNQVAGSCITTQFTPQGIGSSAAQPLRG
jgi:hypothetical protein